MDKYEITFNPHDPIQQLQAQYKLFSTSEIKDIFLDRMKTVVDKCIEHNKVLIIRDHAHNDFLGEEITNVTPLIDFTSIKYEVIPLVTLRNPIDSFLSMLKRGWARAFHDDFNEYCRRYLSFVKRYENYPYYLYEDFVYNPDGVLQEMCENYKIDFDSDYKNRYLCVGSTGGSGRKSRTITPWPRREYTPEFKEEVLKSGYFKEISQKYNYRLE